MSDGVSAPSMLNLKAEVARAYPMAIFAGIPASPDHYLHSPISGHNWQAGHQESAMVNPRTGVLTPYVVGTANAIDETFPPGYELEAARYRNQILLGPGSFQCRYYLDHPHQTGYYPAWRGGGTFTCASAPDQHVSGTPWSTYYQGPWLKKELTPLMRAKIVRAAKVKAKEYAKKGDLTIEGHTRENWMHGRRVAELQAVLNRPVMNPYGPGTARAVKKFQEFFGLKVTGVVNEKTWRTVLFIYYLHAQGF